MADIAAVTRAIDEELPELARGVIRRHLDLEDDDNRHFLRAPDAREQHQTEWHQWGIITHTRVFLRYLDTLVPSYLCEWGLWEAVDARLSGPIDGASKWALLRIAALLHDIGKFGARTRGRKRFHFTHHEKLSGDLIRQELDLGRFGLTPEQIEYVARTAEDHFVLGLVRKGARDQGEYDLAFVRSERFLQVARQIKREHPDDFVEIGVLFLGDSLAKLNPGEGPERAAGQYELNIIVAHRYLETVLEDVR